LPGSEGAECVVTPLAIDKTTCRGDRKNGKQMEVENRKDITTQGDTNTGNWRLENML